jgi:hypothetical protein
MNTSVKNKYAYVSTQKKMIYCEIKKARKMYKTP